jgi:hypothetical protein
LKVTVIPSFFAPFVSLRAIRFLREAADYLSFPKMKFSRIGEQMQGKTAAAARYRQFPL